jgi:hypothetical protein
LENFNVKHLDIASDAEVDDCEDRRFKATGSQSCPVVVSGVSGAETSISVVIFDVSV